MQTILNNNIMKTQFYLLIFLVLFLTSCATKYYGVSEEVWLEMNDNQKQTAIEGYNQRELIRVKQRIQREQARNYKIEEEEQKRLEQIERIYNVDGQMGDLIQLSILSGVMKLGFKNRKIEPASVRLVNGETKEIKISSSDHKYMKYTAQYQDGLVIIGSNYSGDGGIRIPYDNGWLSGKEYIGMSGRGSHKMKNMNIKLTVIPQGKTPAIIIYQPKM